MAVIRVLQMIGSLNIGGSQAMLMNIYRNIDKEKIQFDFILDHPEQLYYADEVKALGGKIYYMPTFKGYNLLQVKKAWNDFFKQHPEYKVLHSHVRSYALVYISIAKKYGVRTIIHSHSTSNGSGINSVVKKIMQYPLRYSADRFLACSQIAGEWLFGKKTCNSPKFDVINNALDVGKYRLDADVRTRYRSEMGVEDKFVYGHVGRLHESKNHLFLLEVFAKLYERDNNSFLLLVGDGELRPQIEEKIIELDISDNVMLLGNRSDIAECLWSMDAFLFPSKWEGLPISVVEAQATGLPCFVSDTVSGEVCLSDLITYLPIDSEDVWVDAILNSEKTKKDVSEDIKKSGYDIENSVNEITKLYFSLMGRDIE